MKKGFEDKIKALVFSLKKNSRIICIYGMMLGSLILSGFTLKKPCKSVGDAIKYHKVITEKTNEITESNDEIIMKLFDDTIMVANVDSMVEQSYYFKDGYLYDCNDKIVSLVGEEKRISFVKCNLDSTILENINLNSSCVKVLDLTYSSIDNNCINYFPSTVEYLLLDYCDYITNLDGLVDRCPNIKMISINNAASLNDLSFIYDFPNLEEVYIRDCVYVTEEILAYLKENNISTNVTEQDVINSKVIDGIIEDIILPDMSDKDKIKTICLYVLNSIEYDIMRIEESNIFPLSCVLKDGKGVCSSYAYMTNVLLNKAGVKSFKVNNSDHGWNIIELDGEYYYIDTTNMDGSNVNRILLELFNVADNYMINPEYTNLSAMSNASSEETIIASNMINDILSGSSNKDIIGKYGGLVLSGSFTFMYMLLGYMVGLNIKMLIRGEYLRYGKKIYLNIRDDYNRYIDKISFERIMKEIDDDIRFVPIESGEDENFSRIVNNSVRVKVRRRK